MAQSKSVSAKNIRSKITAFDVEAMSKSNAGTIQVLGNISTMLEKKTDEQMHQFDRLIKLLEYLPRNQVEQNKQQQLLFVQLAKLAAAFEKKGEETGDLDSLDYAKQLRKEGNKIPVPGSDEPRSLKEALLRKHFGLSPLEVRTQGISSAMSSQFKKEMNFILGRHSKETTTPFDAQVNFEKIYNREREKLLGAAQAAGSPTKDENGKITVLDGAPNYFRSRNSNRTNTIVESSPLAVAPSASNRKDEIGNRIMSTKHIEEILGSMAHDVYMIRLVVHDGVKLNRKNEQRKTGSKFQDIKTNAFVKDPDKGYKPHSIFPTVEGNIVDSKPTSGTTLLDAITTPKSKEGSGSGNTLAPDATPAKDDAKKDEKGFLSDLGGVLTGAIEKIPVLIEGALALLPEILAGVGIVGAGIALGYGIDKGIDKIKGAYHQHELNTQRDKIAKAHGYSSWNQLEAHNQQIRAKEAIDVPRSRVGFALEKMAQDGTKVQTPAPTIIQNIQHNRGGDGEKYIIEKNKPQSRTNDNSFVRYQNKRNSRTL